MAPKEKKPKPNKTANKPTNPTAAEVKANKTPKTKQAAKDSAHMTIWEHLGELRRRLTVIIVGLLVATCVLYFFAPILILFVIQPVAEWLSAMPIISTDQLNQVLNVLDPLGGFTLRFKVSVFFAAIVTSPLWIWQLMAFFLPALKPHERRWVLPTFFVGVVLFIIGTVFCYLIILDPAFAWMLEQTREFANVLANAQDYISLILLFEIAFGFAFELPLIVFYLIVFNIVPYKKLRKSWRVVYVVLLIFCAMVTPDASPVTMLLMFVAMSLLYEGSLLLSRLVLNKRIKRLAAEEEARDKDTLAAEEAVSDKGAQDA
ncbi:MAG: twin-arginine translocase subunit TatC [Coriobacteriales bacterium]|jgi:sec-independent protein translocase protein TatC|nr:twin-arginine translocase subunit TatC [Coriobacteriales bacterium]